MDDNELASLLEMVDIQNPVHNYQESEDFHQRQLRECWEQRWVDNNRAINLRNYEERPEDYR